MWCVYVCVQCDVCGVCMCVCQVTGVYVCVQCDVCGMCMKVYCV